MAKLSDKMKNKNNSGNTHKTKKAAQKAAFFGIMISMALVLSFIESQIPPLFTLPGMKLGLTNIVVVFCLYCFGGAGAMGMNVIRIVLASVMFGGPSAMLYSLAGGMLSTIIMIIMKKAGCFRVITVSIVGGVMHNVGQILIAMLVMKTGALIWYLAALWFTGMASGAFIGLLGGILIRRIPQRKENGS